LGWAKDNATLLVNTFALHEHMPQHNKRDTLPHCAKGWRKDEDCQW